MAEEWGVPPWEIAGGTRLTWVLRWRVWRSEINKKKKRDSEKRK